MFSVPVTRTMPLFSELIIALLIVTLSSIFSVPSQTMTPLPS